MKDFTSLKFNLASLQEFEIIDLFLGPALKDEVLKIMPVQKQTRAGQRTRSAVSSYFSCSFNDELLRIPNLNFFGDLTMAILTKKKQL